MHDAISISIGGLVCKAAGVSLPGSFHSFLRRDGHRSARISSLHNSSDDYGTEVSIDLDLSGDFDTTECVSEANATNADLEGEKLYQAFGNTLPLLHRIIFHGVAVKYDGAGYVFTAPSGTGKSTHAFLWQRYLGRAAHILSGDKPVISGCGGVRLKCHRLGFAVGRQGTDLRKRISPTAGCLPHRARAHLRY